MKYVYIVDLLYASRQFENDPINVAARHEARERLGVTSKGYLFSGESFLYHKTNY